MAMASSSLNCNFKPHRTTTTHRVLCSNPMPNFVFVLKQNEQLYLQTQSLRLQWNKRNVEVRATGSVDSDAEAPPLSSPPVSYDPFTNQLIVAIMGTIMSYLKQTFGPLLIFKDQVDVVVQRVEDVANVVEDVAERVEKVAEDILDDLPEGRLKDIVNYVEDLAEDTADRADSVGDFIDKAQEEGEKLETFMESVDARVDGYLANGNNGQNDLFEIFFANLLPSCETFSYF